MAMCRNELLRTKQSAARQDTDTMVKAYDNMNVGDGLVGCILA
jgi:hypothetical protein